MWYLLLPSPPLTPTAETMINSAQTCQTGLKRLSINYLTWKRLSAFLKCYNNLFAVPHPLEKCDTHIKWIFQPGVLSQFWYHWEETDFKKVVSFQYLQLREAFKNKQQEKVVFFLTKGGSTPFYTYYLSFFTMYNVNISIKNQQ